MSQKDKAKLTFYICEIKERGNIRNEKEAKIDVACIIYKEERDMHVESSFMIKNEI